MIAKLNNRKSILLAVSIGIIYLWFGILKFFPGLSPAEDLARDTIHVLTFGMIPERLSIQLLAIWESAIGVLLIVNFQRKLVVTITLIHMFCTFSVFLIFPELSFSQAPFSLTLVGQYIIKNLVIIGALIAIYPVKQTNAKAQMS